jgi:hypothetical protein
MRSLDFFNWPSPSSHTMAPMVDAASDINEYQESSWGKGQPARKADNFANVRVSSCSLYKSFRHCSIFGYYCPLRCVCLKMYSQCMFLQRPASWQVAPPSELPATSCNWRGEAVTLLLCVKRRVGSITTMPVSRLCRVECYDDWWRMTRKGFRSRRPCPNRVTTPLFIWKGSGSARKA